MADGRNMRRLLRAAAVIAVLAAFVIAAGFISPARRPYSINVAVLYSGSSSTYKNILQHFEQPVLMNLDVTALDADNLAPGGLKGYDIVYPDISVKSSKNSSNLKRQLMDYASSGGAVMLENGFYNWFPKEFLGASSFKKAGGLPTRLELPKVRYDLKNVQKLISDFYSNYKKLRNPGIIKSYDYGFGMVESTAVPIVKSGGISLYTLNSYGKGYVFFTNPILPNSAFINGFDLKVVTKDQAYFNNMICAADQMLSSEFAAFISKQEYGIAIKRVYGPYGRPAAAWQNHFEVLSAIKGGSLQKWTEIARQYDEIPSYSLARGAYEWNTRYESVVYHINRGTGNGLKFVTEESEGFYEAGRHPVVGGAWLAQKKSGNTSTFFVDIGDVPDRAYPYVQDINGDKVPDIVSGSADGTFYFYKGQSSGADWMLSKAEKLKDAEGGILKVAGCSAPVMYDVDGDGYGDLVTGCENGKVYWFKNNGDFHFIPKGEMVIPVAGARLSAPEIGDADGDNIPDLVVGTKNGSLYEFKGEMNGKQLVFGTGRQLKDQNGKALNAGANAAPRLVDLNGDGTVDLAVGNYDGYVRKFIKTGRTFADAGYFDEDTLNYLGNKHIKNGNNAVPSFIDINGDGKKDMIVGMLEFGMAVPIDSRWFPYKKELADAIGYLQKNYVSVEPHMYSNRYKDSGMEQRDLSMHKKAFESLGIKWDNNGANQHTWRINNIDPTQTLYNEYKSGLSWNFGFEVPNSRMDPSYGAETVWSIPFYMVRDGQQTGMMLFSPSPSLQSMKPLYNSTAAWDMPVSYYMHVEYDAMRNPERLEETAAFMDQFRDANDYNFMTEEQMAKSFAAALNTKIKVTENPFRKLLYSIENQVRTLQQFDITLDADVATDQRKLLGGAYRDTAGVKVEAGEKYLTAKLETDADIYMRKGSDLYIGLNRPVRLFTSKAAENRAHIVRVNLPVNIRKTGSGMKVGFLDGGLQQIKLYAPGNDIRVGNREWDIEKAGSGMYVLTRFGGPAELELSLGK
ncbi:MAG TPA: VCBS repeat-containing protein [Clostridia bacterium]|nr:VCBS repeat-containing protein [Clostridia bacterium]